MTQESLKHIADTLHNNNINYEFMQWTSKVVYPYFVGEYSEQEPLNEDGMHESTFILNGFTRKSWLELEQAKEKIENLFNKTVILPNGNGLAVFYSGSLVVPNTGNELKRIQINLAIKEWKVK